MTVRANVCCPNLEILMFLAPSWGDTYGRGFCKIVTQYSLVRTSWNGEHTYIDHGHGEFSVNKDFRTRWNFKTTSRLHNNVESYSCNVFLKYYRYLYGTTLHHTVSQYIRSIYDYTTSRLHVNVGLLLMLCHSTVLDQHKFTPVVITVTCVGGSMLTSI